MKKYSLLLIMFSIILTGCSSNNTTKAPIATATATANREISDSDPLLETASYSENIMLITDPILFNYLKSKDGTTTGGTNVINTQIQDKIGKTFKIKSVSKYGLSGSLSIVTDRLIQLNNFNYNGSCGSLIFKALISSSSKEVGTFSETVTTPLSNFIVNLNIPDSLDLTKFDEVDIYCQGIEKAISSAKITS